MKKVLLTLLMIGTLFGCATSTDETVNGPTEETNTPADYFGIHPGYKESFQLSQGDEGYKFVNFYTEEEKELLNKEFARFYVDDDDHSFEKEFKTKLIATSKDGKHKYDPTKIKIKNVKNVTWYNIGTHLENFMDVDMNLDSYIEEPFEFEDGEIGYFISFWPINYYCKGVGNEKKCQELINNRDFIEGLIKKQEDIYKLKYDLKTFKVKEGFQDADFLDEEKNPYLKWVNVSIPVYSKERDENSFEYKCQNFWEYTNDESLGWDLHRENSFDGDINKIKEAVIAGKYFSLRSGYYVIGGEYPNINYLTNAKIENDEIYITSICMQSLYYLVTLEYENLEYDIIMELFK